MTMPFEQGDDSLSLFVLKLGAAVTENSLYTYLSDNLGIRVRSIRICRTHDKTPLGHGYINCFDAAQKELLREKFDGHLLDGHQRVRVIDVIKDPKARKEELKHANVFIQNLPIGIQMHQLEQCLSEWGHIVSTKIAAPKPGKSSAMAYVQFGSQASADMLIEQAQRSQIQIGNMCISAAPYLPYEQRMQNRNEEFTNLYVKNLPDDIISDENLQALFAPYGPVKSVRLGDSPLGRRYGFVNFENCKNAKAALKGMNGIMVRSGSKPLYVARFMSKAERHAHPTVGPFCYSPYAALPVQDNFNREGRNVYVKHLAADVDEGVLLNIFQNCGPVESVKIMREQNSGASRGFGFVCFFYPQSAGAAISCMQGYQLHGARLYVSMSKPAKETRYRRSSRSARELMQAWPVYDDSFMSDHPMPTNKAFLQVNPIHKTLSI